MMRKVSLFTLTFLAVSFIAGKISAQDNGYTDSPAMQYTDHVYRSYIHTVQLTRTDWQFGPPVIELNSGQQLQFSFDDLEGGYKSYYYTFIHCDANWKPSDINDYDFMKGYQQDFINDYSTSFNTTQPYTHYHLSIPNDNIQLLLSGNYLLKVYLNNDPDSVVITRRFMIYENDLTIHAREKPGIGEELFTRQEIVFSINTSRYNITDPFHALQVFITQNGRWDNAIGNIQPQFVQDTSLQYYADFGNIFNGGNEFRDFDMTSLRMLGDNVYRFVPGKEVEIDLSNDHPRGKRAYITLPDIDGQYLIQDKDGDNSDIDGEYVYVNFYLPMDSAFTTGNLYIFGALSDWKCKKAFMMRYDDSKAEYTATLYLKQGYYDYEYAFLKDGSNVADATLIEGNHSETENTYSIYAYYRPYGVYYDQLVGFKSFHAPKD